MSTRSNWNFAKTLGVLLFAVATQTAASEMPRYLMNRPTGDTPWNLIFPCERVAKAFRDSRTAVELERVYCDGKEITPEVWVPAHAPDMVSVEPNGAQIIYKCPDGAFYSYKSLKPRSDGWFEVKQFKIPSAANLISVTYRIRYPDGKASGAIRIDFVASTEKTTVVETTASK